MKRQNVLCCPQNFALVWSMLLSGIQGQRSHIRFTRTSVQQTRVRFVRLAGFSTIYHITHLWKMMENIIFVSPFFVTGTEDCDLTVSDSHHQRYFMTFQKTKHPLDIKWKTRENYSSKMERAWFNNVSAANLGICNPFANTFADWAGPHSLLHRTAQLKFRITNVIFLRLFGHF